jgi:8-oxo-dGTP pyrophosphatase MutT (NUDIX family)
MLTVYIGESSVNFVEESHPIPHGEGVMYTSWPGAEHFLLFVELLEQHKEVRTLLVRHENPKKAFQEFSQIFRVIEAAGGLVLSPYGKKLFIFRNGKWDLPKGKIEKGEKSDEAAVREVIEECGISGKLEISFPLVCTYHTYKIESGRILKKTFWYEMKSESESVLVPQTEEGITAVKWMNQDEIMMALENTFPSVIEVLRNEQAAS